MLDTGQMNEIIDRLHSSGPNEGTGLIRLRKISGHNIGFEIVESDDDPPYFILKIELT